MKYTVKTLAILLISFSIISCSMIDDYMLGKDNTPKPKQLSEIKQTIQLKKEWTKKVGVNSNANQFFKISPKLHGNSIYTADKSGLIMATDKKSAKTLWQKNIAKNIVSGPYIASNYLAVSTSDAHIALLDAKTGKLLWLKPVSNEILSSPIIANNKLLAKTIDGNLYAFSVKDGKKLWVYEHGSPNLILKSASSPVVDKNYAIVGFADGKLDGVSLDTGMLAWQRSIAYPNGSSDIDSLVDIDATPIVSGSIVYTAAYQGYITALSLESGQFLWRHKLSTYKDLAYNRNKLFATDSQDVVMAFNRSNGSVAWRQTGLKARNVSAPAVRGNYVLIGDIEGVIHILSSKNGKFISRAAINGSVINKPILDGNDVFILTTNGNLVKLTLSA
jgi:outer membrane protein assembly factor BamB